MRLRIAICSRFDLPLFNRDYEECMCVNSLYENLDPTPPPIPKEEEEEEDIDYLSFRVVNKILRTYTILFSRCMSFPCPFLVPYITTNGVKHGCLHFKSNQIRPAYGPRMRGQHCRINACAQVVEYAP